MVLWSHLEAEHREVYYDITRTLLARDPRDSHFADRAVGSFYPHQIKAVEARLPGLNLTGDSHFIAAERVVTDTQ